MVTALSALDIAELFDLRAMLEPDLIRRAVPRLGESDFLRAEALLADYAAAIARGDTEAYGELNREYHLSLYGASGRTQTLELVRMLLANTDRYTRVQLAMSEGATTRAKREHAALLEYCRAGDAEQAARLTLEHVLSVRHDLLQLLQTETDGQAEPQAPAA